tara:strand:+ start:303 stop:536 length:234 start_codon:yes stop_codon:yes gene_type:complete
MRSYNIIKYKNNTHFTVNVVDSFGQEHMSFFRTTEECSQYAYEVWQNEVKQEVDLMSLAVLDCIEIDKKSGRTLSLD